MAEIATVARPYAEALFRVASQSDLSAWADLVSEMAQVAANPEIRGIAANPKVSHQQMRELFMSALKSPVGSEAGNFIGMLTDNGRLTLLPEIAAQFHALKNAGEGAADAEIISAFEMSDAQVQELAGALERRFGRKLRPHVSVDPSLIGGVRVVVGDEVLDTSVRAKLQKMQVALAA
jgi:F-type H+-transporting ATPase subunit delta